MGAGIGVRDLDEPTSAPGGAYALNESGMVVGETFPVVNGRIRPGAAVWTPVGRSAWPDTTSTAINVSNRGWIVGQSGVRAAVWLLGRRLVELPDPDGVGTATALDVNDSGYIIGAVSRHGIGRRSLLWIVR